MEHVLCPKCNEQISEKAEFCKHCGYPTAEFIKVKTGEKKDTLCPSCKEHISPVSKKCPYCGYNISLHQWKSKSLGEKIMDYIGLLINSKGSADF